MNASTRREDFQRALRACLAPAPRGPGPHPLSADPGGGGAGDDPLGALLDRIAGTILPRRLVLTGEGGRDLTLDIARGRVLAIGPGTEGPLQAVTRDEAPAVLASLARIASGPVLLLWRPLGEAPGGPGVAASHLAELHRRPPADPEQVLSQFLAAIDPGDAALLHFERGEVVQVDGAEEALGPLVDFAASLQGGLLASGMVGGPARFILLLSGDDGSARFATVIVIAGESRVLLRFSAELAGPVVDLWRDCLQAGAG